MRERVEEVSFLFEKGVRVGEAGGAEVSKRYLESSLGLVLTISYR